MRAAFSRIGSKISCDANTVAGALICAALMGRRVFMLAAAIVAAIAIVKRLGQRDPVSADEPALDVPAVVRIAPSRESLFHPPRDYAAIAVADVSPLHNALGQAIVGQRDAVEALMLALIADGHVLLEGAPGLAKTLACRTLAGSIAATFSRIQCTADLSPADVVGCEIFDQRDREFRTRLGPLFANIVLVDEINRAPARTQAALLEALEERSVTLGADTHSLPDPFLVLGTMNEAEADGIYFLPAAQLDRFLLKVTLDFPTPRDELEILERFGGEFVPTVKQAVSLEMVREWRENATAIYCAPALKEYIVALVRATRDGALEAGLQHGAGPRAALAMLRSARAKALVAGRSYVLPADVRGIACAALRHRVAFVNSFLLDREECERRLRAIVDGVRLP
jgi:MoxR-like ATPase